MINSPGKTLRAASFLDLSAAEALDLSRVVDQPVRLEGRGRRVIAQWPAPAIRMAKEVLKKGADSTLQQAMEIEAEIFAKAMGTPEHREAVEAMMAAISSKGK